MYGREHIRRMMWQSKSCDFQIVKEEGQIIWRRNSSEKLQLLSKSDTPTLSTLWVHVHKRMMMDLTAASLSWLNSASVAHSSHCYMKSDRSILPSSNATEWPSTLLKVWTSCIYRSHLFFTETWSPSTCSWQRKSNQIRTMYKSKSQTSVYPDPSLTLWTFLMEMGHKWQAVRELSIGWHLKYCRVNSHILTRQTFIHTE